MIKNKIGLYIQIVTVIFKRISFFMIAVFLLIGVSYIGKDIPQLPFCADVIYITDFYTEKIPYVLKNLSSADEISLYDMFDKKLVDSFYEDNGSLRILNGFDFRKTVNEGEGGFEFGTLSYVAYYTYLDKTIYIKDIGPLGEYTVTLAHEFGHYLSMARNYACDAEFYKIAEREVKQLKKVMPYIEISMEEYKAETFAYYILLPELLKKAAPETYEYHHIHYREFLDEEIS